MLDHPTPTASNTCRKRRPSSDASAGNVSRQWKCAQLSHRSLVVCCRKKRGSEVTHREPYKEEIERHCTAPGFCQTAAECAGTRPPSGLGFRGELLRLSFVQSLCCKVSALCGLGCCKRECSRCCSQSGLRKVAQQCLAFLCFKGPTNRRCVSGCCVNKARKKGTPQTLNPYTPKP